MAAYPNGYNFRNELSLTSGGLTDYVSAPEDGLVVHFGSGTDSGADVYLGGNCDASFIDVILTDSSDTLIPFEWAFRKPGDYGVLRWKKSAVASSETLRLYYNKADATYQGAQVDDFVERWQDYLNQKLDDGHYDTTRSEYISVDSRSIAVKNGFAAVAWSREITGDYPEYWVGLYDLFTRSFVNMAKAFVGGSTDAHNTPTPFFDADGNVHVFASQPGIDSPYIITAKSATPYALDFGSTSTISTSAPNVEAYYLQPILRPNGDIWLFFRDWSFWYITSTDDGATWSSATELVRYGSGTTTERVYGFVRQMDDTGDVLVSYSHSTNSGGWRDLGFLYYDSSATAWKAADGTTLSLPASLSDASAVENSAGDTRITANTGPFITSAGEFAFFYGHGIDSAWSTDDLRLKTWNGSSWDDTVVLTDASQIFRMKVRAWEIGSTKYLLVGEEISASRIDWSVRTSSAWSGTWSTDRAVFSNRGNLKAITSYYDAANDAVVAISNDAAAGNIIWADDDAPAYTHSWNAAQSAARAGWGRAVAIANTTSSYLLHAIASPVANPRVDWSARYQEMGSTGNPWYSNIGVFTDVGDFNGTGINSVTQRLAGYSTPAGLEFETIIRDTAVNYLSAARFENPAVGSLLVGKIDWNQTNAVAAAFDSLDYQTEDSSGTATHAMSDTLDVIGFAQPNSGSDPNTGAVYRLGTLHYYEDQSANAPTYVSWSGEETASDAISGDLLVQESGSDTAAITGTVQVTGTLATQETGSDAAAITGSVTITGTLAAQETGPDGFAGTGSVLVAGVLSVQEAGPDVATITGSVGSVPSGGVLSVQEAGPDVATITGSVAVGGALVAQETGSDTAVITGQVHVTGILSVQESGSDTVGIYGAGQVPVSGILSVQETGGDGAAIVGSVIVQGDVSIVESDSDSTVITGSVSIVGALLVQENGSDTVSIIESQPGIGGTFLVQETGSDDASFALLIEAYVDLARRNRVNDAAIRQFGEQVIFMVPGNHVILKAILEWDVPEKPIGNFHSDRPQPYLRVRDVDIEDAGVAARQKVKVQGSTFDIVTQPMKDGSGMSKIYITGTL